MAKIFKHLGFGQKKQPPIPPRPDYEGDGSSRSSGVSFASRPSSLCLPSASLQERPLVVEEQYCDPLDLALPPEEDCYCSPYELAPPPAPEPAQGEEDAGAGEYDEPWDWASSLQVSPGSSSRVLGSSRDPLESWTEEGMVFKWSELYRPAAPPTPDSQPEYDPPWDLPPRSSSSSPVPSSSSSSNHSSPSLASSASEPPPQAPPPPAPATKPSPPPQPAPPTSPELSQQGWYHGAIGRQEAENLLSPLPEGSYLVRDSESAKLDFSLSLKSVRGFMHMKIVQGTDGKFILGQFSKPFTSIPEMINHYSIHKLPIRGAEHISLAHPVLL